MIELGRERAHIEPEEYARYVLGLRGLSADAAGVGRVVVMAWFDVDAFAESMGAQLAPIGLYHLRTAGPVSLLRVPIGAPATISVMEELIAFGARSFIGVGYAGSLQPRIPIGSLVIPGNCERDEGTSYHYLPPGQTVGPTERVVTALREAGAADAHLGPHWTIDAIYRETRDKIRAHASRGILSVDMEAAAVYALARYRGVEAALLLAVSDELWRPDWNPGFHAAELVAARARALETAWRAGGALASRE